MANNSGLRAPRITGGAARGIFLKTPPNARVRPATGYLREAVFSSLGARIHGARVLDCFAGSGAYGLEALSRGAAHVTFLERQREPLNCLRQNIGAVAKSMRRPADAGVRVMHADFWHETPQAYFDVIFADPPYALLEERSQEMLSQLGQWLLSVADRLIILEGPGSFRLPAAWQPALVKCIAQGPRQPTALVLRPPAAGAGGTCTP